MLSSLAHVCLPPLPPSDGPLTPSTQPEEGLPGGRFHLRAPAKTEFPRETRSVVSCLAGRHRSVSTQQLTPSLWDRCAWSLGSTTRTVRTRKRGHCCENFAGWSSSLSSSPPPRHTAASVFAYQDGCCLFDVVIQVGSLRNNSLTWSTDGKQLHALSCNGIILSRHRRWQAHLIVGHLR